MTIGLLAGGQGKRLGGVDKAWLERDGQSQLAWLVGQLERYPSPILVSANTSHERHRALGLHAIADRSPGLGPLAGISAIAEVCPTPWLLSLPVDLAHVQPGLDAFVATLDGHPCIAEDDDRPQPLVALWNVSMLRPAVAEALAAGRLAVMELQARLGMTAHRLPGVRFGNLNTPRELVRAGLRITTQVEA